MKKIMQLTLFVFIAILLSVIFLSLQRPVRMVEYIDGAVVETHGAKGHGTHQ